LRLAISRGGAIRTTNLLERRQLDALRKDLDHDDEDETASKEAARPPTLRPEFQRS
jgi:hypothetical protein